jgi:hypothetical protein
MKNTLYMTTAIVAGGFLAASISAAAPKSKLEVTFSVTGGESKTIVDGSGADEFGNATGVIDVENLLLKVGPADTLRIDGRVTQFSGLIGTHLSFAARRSCVGGANAGKACDNDNFVCKAPGVCSLGSEGWVRNLTAMPQTLTMTVKSSVFPERGPPLGWRTAFDGLLTNDTGSSDVEIRTNSVSLYVNEEVVPLQTLSTPVTPPVDAMDQPVAIGDAGPREVDALASATTARLVWTVTLGPNDEIRLPGVVDEDTVPAGVAGFVVDQAAACIFRMNNTASKLAGMAAKDSQACLKAASKTTGDATACIDDPIGSLGDRSKAPKWIEKLVATFGAFCQIVPNVAVNDCVGCTSSAAQGVNRGLAHELFGTNVLVSSGPVEAKCQLAMTKSTLAIVGKHWKAFALCKRQNAKQLSSDANLVGLCVTPVSTNPISKVAATASKCATYGVVLSSAFPGACAAAGDVAACVGERQDCQYCIAISVADSIDPTALDCDLFDDGVSNGSCLLPVTTTTISTTTTSTTTTTM